MTASLSRVTSRYLRLIDLDPNVDGAAIRSRMGVVPKPTTSIKNSPCSRTS